MDAAFTFTVAVAPVPIDTVPAASENHSKVGAPVADKVTFVLTPSHITAGTAETAVGAEGPAVTFTVAEYRFQHWKLLARLLKSHRRCQKNSEPMLELPVRQLASN